MNNQIYNILNDMSAYLSMTLMKHLKRMLIERLGGMQEERKCIDDNTHLEKFVAAKRTEGCSERTIHYYEKSVRKMFSNINLPVRLNTTEVLRDYLIEYQSFNNCKNSTLDNVRRNISSFFSWLEEEDYIIKNPVRRIHKIRIPSTIK